MVDRSVFDPDDLVTSYEIGERLGVDATLVISWARRGYEMPAPVAFVGKGRRIRLWLWPEIERWAIATDLLQQGIMSVEARGEDPLLTPSQVAELLGWKSSGQAWEMHRRGTFPAPAEQYGRTRLWRQSTVVEWAQTHPRRPRRRQDPGKV